MKKILYIFAVFFIFCNVFASCSNDDNNDAVTPSGNPAEIAAGTYEGTWTRIANGDTTTNEGTIIIAATDSDFTADFHFISTGYSLDASSVANIAYAGSDGTTFVYNNGTSTNTLGSVFAGRIEDGTVSSRFQISQRAGRTMKLFTFLFKGKKNI